MALNRQIKVPMPEKGIVRRKSGRPDVFKVLETFRKDGKPDNKRKCIGQYDVESGMLIPNNAYYELYSLPNPEEKTGYEVCPLEESYSVRLPGAVWLAEQILIQLGVIPILNTVFGTDSASQIVLVATYMVSRGNIIL